MSDESPSERLRRLKAGLKGGGLERDDVQAALTRARAELEEARREKEQMRDLLKHRRNKAKANQADAVLRAEKAEAELTRIRAELEDRDRLAQQQRALTAEAELSAAREAKVSAVTELLHVSAELEHAREALKGAEEAFAQIAASERARVSRIDARLLTTAEAVALDALSAARSAQGKEPAGAS